MGVLKKEPPPDAFNSARTFDPFGRDSPGEAKMETSSEKFEKIKDLGGGGHKFDATLSFRCWQLFWRNRGA